MRVLWRGWPRDGDHGDTDPDQGPGQAGAEGVGAAPRARDGLLVGDADKDLAQGRAELQSHRPVRDISDGATPASDTNITEIPRVLSDRESLAAAVADPAQCFQMFLSSILGPGRFWKCTEEHIAVASLRASRLTVRSWSLHAPESRASAVLQQARTAALPSPPLQNANCSAHSHWTHTKGF